MPSTNYNLPRPGPGPSLADGGGEGTAHHLIHDEEQDAIEGLDDRVVGLEAGGADTASSLILAGHSYLDSNPATGTQDTAGRLMSMFKVEPDNCEMLARSGSQVLVGGPPQNGSVSAVLNAVYPNDRATGPWSDSPANLAVLCWGINDAILGGGAGTLSLFQTALECAISRCRASAVFEATDTVSGLISTNFVEDAGDNIGFSGSNTGVRFNTTGTTTVTIPASFDGGDVAFGFPRGVSGGDMTVTVDAVLHGTVTTDSGAAGTTSHMVYRVTGLAPGAHTIELAVTRVNAAFYWDYFQIEASPPPVVAVVDVPRAPTYGGAWASIDDARVGDFNTYLQAAVDEFDEAVIRVRADDALAKDPDLFVGGAVHPNDRGAGVLSSVIYETVAASGLLTAGRRVYTYSGSERSIAADLALSTSHGLSGGLLPR